MARLAAVLALAVVAFTSTEAADCPAFTQVNTINKAKCASYGCRWSDFYPHCLPLPTVETVETVAVSCPAFTQVNADNKAKCASLGCRWSDFYPHCLPPAPPTAAPVVTPAPTPAATPVPTSCPAFEVVNDFNKKACAALGCRWNDFYPHCIPVAGAN